MCYRRINIYDLCGHKFTSRTRICMSAKDSCTCLDVKPMVCHYPSVCSRDCKMQHSPARETRTSLDILKPKHSNTLTSCSLPTRQTDFKISTPMRPLLRLKWENNTLGNNLPFVDNRWEQKHICLRRVQGVCSGIFDRLCTLGTL